MNQPEARPLGAPFFSPAAPLGAAPRLPSASVALPPGAGLPAPRPPRLGEAADIVGGNLEKFASDLEAIVGMAKERNDKKMLAAATKEARSARKMLENVRGTVTGSRDSAVLLTRQPTASQIAAPGRRALILRRATEKMEKSKYAFPSPLEILGSVALVLAEDSSEEKILAVSAEAEELEHRILHFLAEGNLVAHGLVASSFLMRLVRAGRAAAAAPSGQTPEECLSMRSTLSALMADGRGR